MARKDNTDLQAAQSLTEYWLQVHYDWSFIMIVGLRAFYLFW